MVASWLRDDVTVVPLVDRWYAWPHLIAPVNAALNVARRHLPILDSYANAPALHRRAVTDEANIGGPFMDYASDRSAEIRALANATRRNHASALVLADAVRTLDDLLDGSAPASPMEPLYEQVPNVLKGYVELVRERGGEPGMRFIEELLYRSPHYRADMQSFALRVEQASPRPFSLSTPVLDDADVVIASMPFDDPRVDRLAMARVHPVDASSLIRDLGVHAADASRWFTSRPPERRTLQGESAVRILGHASAWLQHQGTSVLIDPVIGYASACDNGGWTYADLPDKIDAIVITHLHQDHFFLESLLQLRCRTRRVIVPMAARGELTDPSPAAMLRRLGFGDVVEAPPLLPIAVGALSVTALPFLGEHGDLPVGAKASYAVEMSGKAFIFMADHRHVEPRLGEHLARHLPPVDTLFIGMECDGAPMSWLYGPLLPGPVPRDMDRARSLSGSNCAQALHLVESFQPKRVFVYAMGQERWLRHITSKIYTDKSLPMVEARRFIQACNTRGVEAALLLGPHTMKLSCRP